MKVEGSKWRVDAGIAAWNFTACVTQEDREVILRALSGLKICGFLSSTFSCDTDSCLSLGEVVMDHIY